MKIPLGFVGVGVVSEQRSIACNTLPKVYKSTLYSGVIHAVILLVILWKKRRWEGSHAECEKGVTPTVTGVSIW